MVHDVTKQYIGEIATLTIHSPALRGKALAPTYGEITKLGAFGGAKGIRVKIRDAETDNRIGTLNIVGEDLFALRELLAELPEEAFVRPADPVEKVERWHQHDVIEETSKSGKTWIWERLATPHWSMRDDVGSTKKVTEDILSSCFDGGARYSTFRVLRQASGQDL